MLTQIKSASFNIVLINLNGECKGHFLQNEVGLTLFIIKKDEKQRKTFIGNDIDEARQYWIRMTSSGEKSEMKT